MKKFLFVSAIIAAIGLAVGFTADDTPGGAVTAAKATTTTAVAASAPVEATPAAPVPAPVVKATAAPTGTTIRRVTPTTIAAPTTTTTAAPVTTTTKAPTTTTTAAPVTTTTTVAAPQWDCTVTVAAPVTTMGDQQTVTLTSNAPARRFRLEVQYPKFNTGRPNPRLRFVVTTDGAGGLTQTFVVNDTSTVPVQVMATAYNDAGQPYGNECVTYFQST